MEKQTYIYGIRAVIEAIEAKETLDKVFIQKGLQGDLIKTLENLIRKQGLNTSYVPIEKLDRLAKQHNNHQGVVASISPIEFHELDPFVECFRNKRSPFILTIRPTFRCQEFWCYYKNCFLHGSRRYYHSKKRYCSSNCRHYKNFCRRSFSSTYY